MYSIPNTSVTSKYIILKFWTYIIAPFHVAPKTLCHECRNCHIFLWFFLHLGKWSLQPQFIFTVRHFRITAILLPKITPWVIWDTKSCNEEEKQPTMSLMQIFLRGHHHLLLKVIRRSVIFTTINYGSIQVLHIMRFGDTRFKTR